MKVGWIRPISLWPFPAETVAAVAERVRTIAVFEQNAGQMVDDVRLAVEGRTRIVPIGGISHDHSGFGVGPALEPASVVARITAVYEGRAAA
jgi:2-oxoglutarate ferredoxin oxidoreductase subunit alpha